MGSTHFYDNVRLGDEFSISCGTVTVDKLANRVLAVRHKVSNEYMLPKGRKNMGERLEDTSLRETLEESGVRGTLLAHSVQTASTVPESRDVQLQQRRYALHTEPIAVQQRVLSNGQLKIIFWYIALADSQAPLEPQRAEDARVFEAVWADAADVSQTLTFEDDRQIALWAMAIAGMQAESFERWNPDHATLASS